eukprot:UN05256
MLLTYSLHPHFSKHVHNILVATPNPDIQMYIDYLRNVTKKRYGLIVRKIDEFKMDTKHIQTFHDFYTYGQAFEEKEITEEDTFIWPYFRKFRYLGEDSDDGFIKTSSIHIFAHVHEIELPP